MERRVLVLASVCLLCRGSSHDSMAKHVPGDAPRAEDNMRNHKTGLYRPDALRQAAKRNGFVPWGESSRQYRRTVYEPHDWVKHRASGRIFRNLNSIMHSAIARNLQQDIFLVTSIAVFVVVWNGIVVPSEVAHGIFPYLTLPSLPFTISIPALALLLVFRTNASYGRFIEARSTWGRIIAHSQNIVRMAVTFMDTSDPAGRRALGQLSRATWALSRSLMNQLTGPADDAAFEQELRTAFTTGSHHQSFYDPIEIDDPTSFVSREMSMSDHQGYSADGGWTIKALAELSLVLNALPIHARQRLEIDKSLVIITECHGSCRRILGTPVPVSYTRLTGRFLTVWMVMLPFSLYSSFASVQAGSSAIAAASWLKVEGTALVPVAAFLSLFLFGIEELAIQLEEPFSLMPMQKFCDDMKDAFAGMRDWSFHAQSRLPKRSPYFDGNPLSAST